MMLFFRKEAGSVQDNVATQAPQPTNGRRRRKLVPIKQASIVTKRRKTIDVTKENLEKLLAEGSEYSAADITIDGNEVAIQDIKVKINENLVAVTEMYNVSLNSPDIENPIYQRHRLFLQGTRLEEDSGLTSRFGMGVLHLVMLESQDVRKMGKGGQHI